MLMYPVISCHLYNAAYNYCASHQADQVHCPIPPPDGWKALIVPLLRAGLSGRWPFWLQSRRHRWILGDDGGEFYFWANVGDDNACGCFSGYASAASAGAGQVERASDNRQDSEVFLMTMVYFVLANSCILSDWDALGSKDYEG